ncbi:type II secretion system secretin GspD [Variovorax sp. dw_308]|uniref:type II secretion system secretin GspD n=1 Tax=Variovorax sp. dw_308 TaxID=2721546 RepID=UPI001C473847|nr:type II secretion system secretin GspD [Variovorax sp. dw_308]
MKHPFSHGARIGIVALAAHLLFATCMPAAFAQQQPLNPDAPRRGEPITLNFTNAEIESVARTMAVVTGRDVVVDPRVKGTITLQTDRAIAPATAFNQFAAALRLQGFSVVETEGLYKVVPEADAKLLASNVTTSTGATARAGSSSIVTQVFRLNYESPNNLLPVLRPLIPPNNTINVNTGNNSLVITDYADNMRRLGRIIAALDVPNASDIEVIPLKYSVATDLVPLVQRLIDGGGATGPGGAPGVAPGTADTAFRTTLIAEPRSNSLILRAANPARAQLVRTLVDRLDRAPIDTTNGAAGNIYVIYLKNADAVKLATTLRAALASDARGGSGGLTGAGAAALNPSANQAGLQQGATPATTPLNNSNQPSTGGQIQADPATNSLIITASEPQYRQIRAVVDRLDGRRAQVMIEALIVEVNATRAAQFGVQWQSALGQKGDTNVGLIGTNSTVTGANILALSAALAGSAPVAALSTLSAGLNVGVAHMTAGQYILGFIASFLASDGAGNVLSTPNLLTLDNEEAKIVVGQNVPFPTGSYASTNGNTSTVNPFTTVERKDVGLTMRVRPTINENGTVRMTIFQEVSSVAAGTETAINGPTTNKRSIESSVLVEDGSIVMLGGMLQDDYSTNTDKVPLAGDIPILGSLFKSEKRSRNKTNLMVFLRPTVMRDAAATDAFSADRYNTIRSLQLSNQPEPSFTMKSVDQSAIVPPLNSTSPTPQVSPNQRIEGTRLVPPPMAPYYDGRRLDSGPLRGALPPTADPASARELP